MFDRFSAHAKQAFSFAAREDDYIGTEHLLLGLLEESERIAARVLTGLGVKLEDAREEVLEFLDIEATEENDE